MRTAIPTEPIGSIPRPQYLVDAYLQYQAGKLDASQLAALAEQATIETIAEFEKTGSPCISDGEQRKFSGFASYGLHQATNVAPQGVVVTFSDGHSRTLPVLTAGPFRYSQKASDFLQFAKRHSQLPIKQAVISPSLLSLIYPSAGLSQYSRQQFLQDVVNEHVAEIKSCFAQGAHKVQIDFTEGRLSLKLDPSGQLLNSFIELINRCMSHFSEAERARIGIHTCPGSDCDATHSADVDYKFLLPTLFEADVGSFYVAMAGEQEPELALRMLGRLVKPNQRVFVGVIDPITTEIETPELVCRRLLAAAEHIPVAQLGSTDDCGFAPFADDTSTSRQLAFAKIAARVAGTAQASAVLLR